MRSRERIDEGGFFEVHGIDQWMALRGEDSRNPVVLVLSGPGVALSAMTPFFAPWERSFTLVQWDQPGAGATQARNGDAGTGSVTVDRLARDGIAVAELAREKLGAGKVAVLAVSGGTIVGLKMVKARPDLFFAYVGSGQVVSWARQQAASYALVLERAREKADDAAVAELEAIGPPPYRDTATDAVHSRYASAFTEKEQKEFATLDPAVLSAMRKPPEGARYVPTGLALPDPRAQATVTYDRLRPAMVSFDARSFGLEFEVPMFFIQGTDDHYTVTSEVERYVAELRAPSKDLVRIEGGGHSVLFLREPFLRALERLILPPKSR
jgi:pimeloyl-ACP methyl ester carboxylesterase